MKLHRDGLSYTAILYNPCYKLSTSSEGHDYVAIATLSRYHPSSNDWTRGIEYISHDHPDLATAIRAWNADKIPDIQQRDAATRFKKNTQQFVGYVQGVFTRCIEQERTGKELNQKGCEQIQLKMEQFRMQLGTEAQYAAWATASADALYETALKECTNHARSMLLGMQTRSHLLTRGTCPSD